MDRSQELFANFGDYNGQDHAWRFKEKGNILEFGACQRPGDEKKWQGRPHDFVGFDEIPHFLESQFRYLCGWVRTTRRDLKPRVIAAGNPPTDLDGQWIKRYWAGWLREGHHPFAPPGDLLWYTTLKGEDFWVEKGNAEMRLEVSGEFLIPLSRTFIPARLADNLFLNPEYIAQLQGMPEPLRSQLLYGDMDIENEVDPWQIMSAALLLARMTVPLDYIYEGLVEQVGVDCSRGGADETVAIGRAGSLILPPIAWPGKTTTDGPKTAALIATELKRRGWDRAAVVVDVIGIGASVYDSLKQLLPRVYGFNSAEASTMMDRTHCLKMANNRAAGHWTVREWLDDADDPLYLPIHEKLRADLLAPRWELTPRGILVEAKDDIKERLGRSPDYGDATIMACVNLNATDWKGLLEFAKEELVAREKAKEQKRREAAREPESVSNEPKSPPSARALMERFGSVLK